MVKGNQVRGAPDKHFFERQCSFGVSRKGAAECKTVLAYCYRIFQLGLNKNWVKVFLRCSFNVAALEITVPTLLVATHLYSPLSVLFTLVMLSSLWSADKTILSLAVTAYPSLVQENVGSGTPFASLEKVTVDPCTSVLLCGCSVNSGLSVIRN